MAMEVVWSRCFAGVLKTQVYSFAMILFAYLLATFLGSVAYRRNVRLGRTHSLQAILWCMAIAALFPVVMIDPSLTVRQYQDPAINPTSAFLLLGSILPLWRADGISDPGSDRHIFHRRTAAGGHRICSQRRRMYLGPAARVLLSVADDELSLRTDFIGVAFRCFLVDPIETAIQHSAVTPRAARCRIIRIRHDFLPGFRRRNRPS